MTLLLKLKGTKSFIKDFFERQKRENLSRKMQYLIPKTKINIFKQGNHFLQQFTIALKIKIYLQGFKKVK